MGTVDYISPDHIGPRGNPTPAWDIYSLGCTLYYAVTGKVPFPGGTTADKARAHCELRPLDPRRLNPRLSAEFVDVLAEMMAKDPAQRLQSAAAVIARMAPWVDRTARPLPAAGASESRGCRPPGAFRRRSSSRRPCWCRRSESSVAAAAAGGEPARYGHRFRPHSGPGSESDSEESLSVEVDMPSMIPLVQPLLLCIIMPLVLVGLLDLHRLPGDEAAVVRRDWGRGLGKPRDCVAGVRCRKDAPQQPPTR